MSKLLALLITDNVIAVRISNKDQSMIEQEEVNHFTKRSGLHPEKNKTMYTPLQKYFTRTISQYDHVFLQCMLYQSSLYH